MKLSRRQFLQVAAAAGAAPMVLPPTQAEARIQYEGITAEKARLIEETRSTRVALRLPAHIVRLYTKLVMGDLIVEATLLHERATLCVEAWGCEENLYAWLDAKREGTTVTVLAMGDGRLAAECMHGPLGTVGSVTIDTLPSVKDVPPKLRYQTYGEA